MCVGVVPPTSAWTSSARAAASFDPLQASQPWSAPCVLPLLLTRSSNRTMHRQTPDAVACSTQLAQDHIRTLCPDDALKLHPSICPHLEESPNRAWSNSMHDPVMRPELWASQLAAPLQTSILCSSTSDPVTKKRLTTWLSLTGRHLRNRCRCSLPRCCRGYNVWRYHDH